MEGMLDRNLITQALGISDAEDLSDNYILDKIRQLSNTTRPASTYSENAKNANGGNSTTRNAQQCSSRLQKILEDLKTDLPRFYGKVKEESAFEFLEALSEFQGWYSDAVYCSELENMTQQQNPLTTLQKDEYSKDKTELNVNSLDIAFFTRRAENYANEKRRQGREKGKPACYKYNLS